MYRLIVESLLGLTLQVDDDGARLLIRPCLPAGWTGYHVDYRFRETTYRIDIERTGGAYRRSPWTANCSRAPAFRWWTTAWRMRCAW